MHASTNGGNHDQKRLANRPAMRLFAIYDAGGGAMSMSMNIHGAAGISLSDIRAHTLSDGRVFYTRSIVIADRNGNTLICIDPFSDDGYKLLIDDAELASLTTELPLLKAA